MDYGSSRSICRRRPARRGRSRISNLALIACLFPHISQPSPVGRRNAGEHVVLADCLDNSKTVSSQMAYFVSDPSPTPKDVAVVATAPGQAALWVNTNTSALFTDTGVTFNATLGPRVNEGDFAGTGTNSYANFTCWQRYVPQLYTYGSTTCSQVYDCDHEAKPASTPAAGGGLSHGAVIAIAVGVAGGLLFAAAAALVFWFCRRSRREAKRRDRAAAQPQSLSLASPTLRGDITPVPAVEEPKPIPSAVHEIDGRLVPIEMASDHDKFEMDGQGRGEGGREEQRGQGSDVDARRRVSTEPGLDDPPVLNRR